MKIVKAGFQILTPITREAFLDSIERAGRVCCKSEDKITEDSASKFVRMLTQRGHEAMIEHAPSLSVKFICDRGVSHEIVRHRIASFAQESTRYCNYSQEKFRNEITVIKPLFWDWGTPQCNAWIDACEKAEQTYFDLLDSGATPQEARSVLPNSLKIEIIMTANIREWRHFFKLRTSKEAHPQMREIARPLLDGLQDVLPELFDDISYDEQQ